VSQPLSAAAGTMPASPYAGKPDGYFGHARTDIAVLLPADCGKVLEVGCGSGATLAWLKAQGRCTQTTGIELVAEAAAVARGRVDHVRCGDALTQLPEVADHGPFDTVLCLDVLEHLQDPWRLVDELAPLLRPGGLLVASLPNVRHWRVTLPLLLQGRFRYADDGVLDRTHLRFFTAESARSLLWRAPFEPVAFRSSRPPRGSLGGWMQLLSLGQLADHLAVQHLLSARRG
jgi:SAM-dependent methyltransferase